MSFTATQSTDHVIENHQGVCKTPSPKIMLARKKCMQHTMVEITQNKPGR